jgi:hypothetical protein
MTCGADRLKIKTLSKGFWRAICSYKRAEARGQSRGVTLATPNYLSPLQVIEIKKLKSVPKQTFSGSFRDGQAFGRKRKLLGCATAYSAIAS